MDVVVLTGFMGTGKSTVGRLLADRLAARFLDTDTVIEQRHGPIPAIFAEHGEDGFRRIERELARELALPSGNGTPLVVSTGGGMLLDPEVAAIFESAPGARVVCLVADPAEILRRVTADGPPLDRPLLADANDPADRIAELLERRASGYGRFDQVATDGRTPDEVVDAVLEIVS